MSKSKLTEFLILFILFFVMPILILGTNHVKGIIIVFGFMLVLIFVILLIRSLLKIGD